MNRIAKAALPFAFRFHLVNPVNPLKDLKTLEGLGASHVFFELFRVISCQLSVNTVPISSVLSVSSESKPRRSPNETAQCMNSKPPRTCLL
jgi:hypothetical protein